MDIKKFRKLFFELGELCLKIRAVERPKDIFDYTKDDFPEDAILERFPDIVASFYMAMHRTQAESIKCFLIKDGTVVIEFYDSNWKLEKTASYKSILAAQRNKISVIHHLSRISTRINFH